MPRSWRRTRIAAASALILGIAAALYLVLVNDSNGAGKTGGNSSSRYTGSTTIERRNLVEQDTESGTLGHARSYTVYNRVSGTVTWLPSAGTVIKPGQTLYRIDNKPVLLMDGTTPAYRNLDSSDSSGPDILELNANLVDLGYNPDGIVVDDTWQAATTAAVKELQHALGEGESGKILLGKVVFLPGKQLVSSVQGNVGSTVSLTDPSSHAEFVSLDTTTSGLTPADTTNTAATTTDTTTTAATTTTTGTTTTPATSTTPTTTVPTTTTPTTTTPNTTPTTTTPKTHTNTTPPRTSTGTTTTPKTHTSTTPPARTPTRSTPSTTTPSRSTTIPSGDNLSERTLRALLQLVREQQQALAHQHNGNPSHNGSPSSSSNPPSSSSNPPSKSSHSPSSNSHSPSSSSNPPASPSHSPSSSKSPSKSSHSPSKSSHSPSSGSHSPSSSGGGGAGTPIMDTTSPQLVVTVDLSPSSQSEAVVGDHVTVVMPDGSSVPGTISAVSSVAQSSGGGGATGNTGSGGSSSVPVTITLDKHVSGKGLDQASVSVNFVQARASHVLSVPVTALLATSGSTYAVQEAARPHKLIPVHTGMFAAGYVQISGSGIHPGLRVTDSQG